MPLLPKSDSAYADACEASVPFNDNEREHASKDPCFGFFSQEIRGARLGASRGCDRHSAAKLPLSGTMYRSLPPAQLLPTDAGQ